MSVIADKLDIFIMIALALFCVIYAANPGMFIKSKEGLEKVEKQRKPLLVLGIFLILFGLFRLFF